jgi:NitT/TauT family transport system substrate-binding protein
MTKHRRLVALAAAGALVLAACGDDDGGGSADTTAAAETTIEAVAPTVIETTAAGSGECTELTPVKLQLQWVTQAQFAGYFAAVDQGFYEDLCLDVEILEGGVDIVPQGVLASGGADFALAWVPKALASREQGAEITNIAQIYQRSGTLQVAFADAGIETPEDLAGKTVGNWGFGNEFELFAGLTQAGLDPAADVDLVAQQFDMNALIAGDIDAAQAMTYNEYAQVLETVNPATGELFQPEDLVVIDWNEVGTAMLQDAIWADSKRLADDAEYQATAAAFVKGSVQGWVYCRDNPDSCVDIVLANGSQLGRSHQTWQMNEVNKLIWPSPNGIGFIDQAAWDQTVEVALTAKNLDGATVITEEPSADAFTNAYAEAAIADWETAGVDVRGESWEPVEVTLEEGGA